MTADFIHPNTPLKLVKAFKAAGSYHRLADEIGVNVGHVHNLIRHGREPKDPEIRQRLFLPRRPRRPRKPRPPKPQMEQAIESMQRRTYDAIKKAKHSPN